ncbi:MAG: hydantoinase/oxoprolinase family protein [Thermoplasmatales archaeon]|nr:hydantoinase/oxoprolinase family protein [Thermoplasmatales archaeon]
MAKRSEFDQWAIDWIESEKKAGRKCFDVKKRGNSYYVYYQSTRYNAETKKREKVSGYLGRLIEGVGLVEPDSYSEDDEIVTPTRYGLGVDTGGTYTDAVILDLDDFSVVAKRKSRTTHHDLTKGLYASVEAVFASCDVQPEEIALVGISTTLATNSVLEGHGGQVGLLLIGWDPMSPVNFGEKTQAFIKGGFDSKGRAVQALSKADVVAAIEKVSDGIDAIAISGLFANLNPSQEKKVKELAMEITGLPTVAGHELSAEMGIDVRAETAVLNGRLIPIVSKFFDGVESTFRGMGITAPIMAYKGDGSVMTLEEARKYPVETILSGPAASSMGGKVLSGVEDCVVVDIGGTSTDIAVMDGGFPQIQFDGARVGGWRTRVKAVDMRTVALGGDSRIHIAEGNKFLIGPERVIPLSTFVQGRPGLARKIAYETIFEYYEADDSFDARGLGEKEARIFAAAKGRGPVTQMEIMDATKGLWIIDEELKSLVSQGALEMASLTPTDVMVTLGLYENGDRKGAEAGVEAVALRTGMTRDQAAHVLYEEIKVGVAEAIMSKMFDDEFEAWRDRGSETLMRRMAGLDRNGKMSISANFSVPIVGIGAPARHMMSDIAERLGAEVIFPENHDVGNAVGVITSKISESMTAVVVPTPDYRFMATVPFMGASYHAHLGSAVSSARSSLESMLHSKVKGQGGRNIATSSKIKTFFAAEGRMGEWDETVIARTVNRVEIVSRAIGDPPEVL